jgi:hypothetical protein
MTPIAVIGSNRHHDNPLILMPVTAVFTLIVVLMLAPSPSVSALFNRDKNREAAAASEQQDRYDDVPYILFHFDSPFHISLSTLTIVITIFIRV